jgi:signal transduction histidine kinase
VFARLRLRLLGWTLLVLALILALVGATVYLSLQRSLAAEVDRNLASQAETIANQISGVGEAAVSASGYQGGLFFVFVQAAPGGRVVHNPQGVDLQQLPLGDALPTTTRYATINLDGTPARIYVLPLIGPRGRPGVLITGEGLQPEQQALHSLVIGLATSAAAGLLLSLAGAWFLVGRSLVPIQRAYSRQQEFAADAAHELRTPLTVLRAATDVLQQHREEPLSANGQLFDDVRHEIVRMEELTGDLLTLARSDLGELELAVADIELGALAAKVVRQVTPLAQEREVALTLEPGVPVTVEADPNRLQQILLILLDNALKYTPTGGQVRVRVGRQGDIAQLAVSDNGPGISSEHLARLFDRFYRVDPSRSRQQGGAGLGLAIARSLVAAHGGQISLSSAPGKGTTVLVRLPVTRRPSFLAERFGHLGSWLPHAPRR